MHIGYVVILFEMLHISKQDFSARLFHIDVHVDDLNSVEIIISI